MSNELTKYEEEQLGLAKQKATVVIQRWHTSLSNSGTTKGSIPSERITTLNGLKSMRINQMLKVLPKQEIAGIVDKQLAWLVSNFNFTRNMNATQISTLSELIIDDFGFFSFTAIMDCFRKLVTAKHPFDGELMESLDARKVCRFLNIYHKYQQNIGWEHLQAEADKEKVNPLAVIPKKYLQPLLEKMEQRTAEIKNSRYKLYRYEDNEQTNAQIAKYVKEFEDLKAKKEKHKEKLDSTMEDYVAWKMEEWKDTNKNKKQ